MNKGLIFMTVLLTFFVGGCTSGSQDTSRLTESSNNPVKEILSETEMSEGNISEGNISEGNMSGTENSEGDMTKENPSEDDARGDESASLSLPDHDTGDQVTPYQFLNLMVGNADEISFSYSQTVDDTDDVLYGSFAMDKKAAAESFMAYDMNGNIVTVRELEKEGMVHYIMQDSERVCTYIGPSDDFLMFQMLEAAKTSPERALWDGEYMLYEHRLYLEEDDEMFDSYLFYMKENTVKKLDVVNTGNYVTHYEFSDFTQEIQDRTVFEIPQGYQEEKFDYQYTYDFMPPWWDVGNDT